MTAFSHKYYFFSGKGGAGKTSISSATAVHLAASGKKTLIITTDPASNLADVFEQPIGHQIIPIAGQPNLFAMELDPDKATAEYKERTLAPLRDMLPEPMLKVMEEQLDSPCTTEMATFERFVGFLDEDDFDAVVFDTAPTGHTLRLLELPADWSRVIASGAESDINTCIGPAKALAESKARFDKALAAIKDPELTRFVFVLRPEASSVQETSRSIGEIRALGIANAGLIANAVIPHEAGTNAFFRHKRLEQLAQLEDIVRLDSQAQALFLLEYEIKGIERLRAAAHELFDSPVYAAELLNRQTAEKEASDPVKIEAGGDIQKAELGPSAAGETHLIFFAGKGGVGKTVMSCIAAINLADHGHSTLLVTTDPAAHLSQVLGCEVDKTIQPVEGIGNLRATRIDPKAEAEQYKARILADAAGKYSPERLAAMTEELDSPCTEEMAVFYRFVELAGSSEYENIVFDTAPTGHTLRLLKLPVDWSKQLEIKTYAAAELSEADAQAKSQFDKVIRRLQDQLLTSFVFVVYPELTPIIEAHRAALQLESIGVKTAMVIANQVLSAEYCDQGFFAKRFKMQKNRLNDIKKLFRVPVVLMPLLADDPQGIEALRSAPINFSLNKLKGENYANVRL